MSKNYNEKITEDDIEKVERKKKEIERLKNDTNVTIREKSKK